MIENDLVVCAVNSVMNGRRSIRAFSQRPVSARDIEDILGVAARAPSGVNTQPWKVYVLRSGSKAALSRRVCEIHDALHRGDALPADYGEQYPYYPEKWFSPYLERRRQNGFALYDLLGIAKGDKERMHRQHQQNFQFFGAPVGLMFTAHRDLGQGSLLDYGMFLQNVMLAARARGLDTCPQAAWNHYAGVILPHIGALEHEMLVCGMSLGYAESTAPVNTLATPREPVGNFVTYV